MPLLALAAWLGALVAHGLGAVGLWVAAAVPVAAGAGLRRRRGAGRATEQGSSAAPAVPAAAAVAALVLAVSGAVTLVHEARVAHNPVARLALDGAVATVEGVVTSDPRTVAGRFGDRVLVRLDVRTVTGRGRTHALSTPVVLIGGDAWRQVPLGSRVRTSGLLRPSDGSDAAALLLARGDPVRVARPHPGWRAAAAVRSSLRRSVAHLPDDQRALVPALVDGDDTRVDEDLADDFRVTGLTHLLAVSGTNLTLLVGFLLVLARWVGVRGRWLHLVGALGIAGFVLLARTEPSVVRAAVMGAVALLGLGRNGRQRGTRGLGVAVVVLLLVQPGLAVSVGFALSALATGGILLLGPPWRDALARWLPRWVAEAIAVPATAQLACTPLVAAISGQVSLVAVAANLAAAPVVGPATVLGLAAGLLGLVSDAVGRVAGTVAGWCVAWLVSVARHGAALPSAALDWGTGMVPLAVLTVLTVVVALVGPRLLARPTTGLASGAVLLLAVLVRPPVPGWPPDGWVMVACDVGQGDALVLRAGPHTGVVVDAGPDPGAVDDCLRRLEVTRVPLLVLTHFHADHVDGIDGVLHGRAVGAVETTRLQDPPQGVREVAAATAADGLAARPATYAATRTIGDVTLQVLWPTSDSPTVGPGDGSTANEASVVLLAEVRGVRILLSGDIEPEGQEALARSLPGLRVDVLKVPHHGSRYQDLDFLLSLGARVALVSVGADNDYGHPSADTLVPLEATGARVLRTDLDGDLVVVERDGHLGTVTGR
ncbi:ComEC/Rec2 family competence protein [Nocardioides sp. KIGAM211]|uniref:ComEC/Rec2 family competence protein n=2 Tax=Nocardioides luti TaxID=2761101 RepID=A0A7X0RJ75_9ACTN|nr:ComEC/Rec2 family competence protein [Nocardioides luti]MBB6629301.1 ComEC/Rec2 family competence protein [Nocardioides luti]